MSTQVYRLADDGTGQWSSIGRKSIPEIVVITPPPPDPTDPTADPTPPQDRTLPDYPTVKFESLYRAGDTFQQTVARMSSYAVLEFGSDVYEVDDFTAASASFGFFRSFVIGYAGQGRGSGGTQLKMKPNSSTQVARVPVQQEAGASNPLTFGRIGVEPASNHTNAFIVHDLQMIGTNQPLSANNGGKPHNYSGMLNYYGRQAIFQSLLIKGFPGDYNSPPGETFQLNDYKGIGNIYRDIEVDGRNDLGEIVGGSPLGFNNSVESYVEDCYFHDSRVSSLTYSFSGTRFNAASSSKDVTTRRVKIEGNANHIAGKGQGFSCINHEGVAGYVNHHYSDLALATRPGDTPQQWDDAHITLVSVTGDAQYFMDHVKWSGGYSLYGGAFVASMPKTYVGDPSTQVTPPRVTDRQGRELAPLVLTTFPRTAVPIDITKQYILLNA